MNNIYNYRFEPKIYISDINGILKLNASIDSPGFRHVIRSEKVLSTGNNDIKSVSYEDIKEVLNELYENWIECLFIQYEYSKEEIFNNIINNLKK